MTLADFFTLHTAEGCCLGLLLGHAIARLPRKEGASAATVFFLSLTGLVFYLADALSR